MVGGGGSGDAAAAQNLADAARDGRQVPFLERNDWKRLLIAAIPLIAAVVLGFILL